VDENMIYELKGINSQLVYTIGSVTLRVQLGPKEATVKIQVVHDNFPIVEAGILGAPFFIENVININFRTSTLSTEHTENPKSPEPPDLPKTLTIQPRSRNAGALIYAVDLTEHESRLEEVFQRLRKFNVQLQPSKCQFLRSEVVYLGHLITDTGVKPDPVKISCVRDHPVPRNPTEIKQFLGHSGYYRTFIDKYSQIAKPLTNPIKKVATFRVDCRVPSSI